MIGRLAAIIGGLRGRRGWLPDIAAGAISALALPPLHWLPLLWLAFPYLVWRIDGSTSWRGAFAIGWRFGFGLFVASLYWLANAFLVEAEAFAWAIPLGTLGLPALLAIYSGLATALARLAWPANGWRIVSLAASWTLLELVRGYALTGFPWNLMGYVWSFSAAMSQGAALFGVYGLSFLAIFIAASPAALSAKENAPRAAFAPFAIALLLLATMAGCGGVRLMLAKPGFVPDVRLRIVQANIDQRDKWDRDKREEHLLLHMQLSQPAGDNRTNYIIWPEAAISYFIDREPARRVMIGRLARPEGLVITGIPRYEEQPDGSLQWWNSLIVLNQEGRELARYDKSHLVPFGEYLPFRPILSRIGLEKLVEVGGGDFSQGPGRVTISAPGLPPFSPLICYEIIFPGQVVADLPRPEWILNLTNDGWYGDSAGPYQHYAMAQMRAIEEGLPVVRAAGTGISGVIDPWGRTINRLGFGERGALDSILPTGTGGMTPFSASGNAFPLAGSMVILLVMTIKRRRR